jgi:hypothetical protein
MRAALLAGEASRAHILRSAGAEHRDFYRTTQRHDRWWLVTPEGEIFFSSGLNHIER